MEPNPNKKMIAVREARGHSIKWCASRIGVSSGAWYRWEYYGIHPRTPALQAEVCRVLNVKPHEIGFPTIMDDIGTNTRKELNQ